MKFIAHRGYSRKCTDNSIEAVKKAIQKGYDGVEIDIQLCKTGEIVLYHDIYVKDSFVFDLSFDELRELGVISLHELYEHVPEIKDTLLFLDLKGNDDGIVKALKDFYYEKDRNSVFCCSFNRPLVYKLKDSFKIGTTFEAIFNENELQDITRGMSVVFVHWTCLTDVLVSHCKRSDIPLYTYTHKENKELEYMLKFDIAGVITNGVSEHF